MRAGVMSRIAAHALACASIHVSLCAAAFDVSVGFSGFDPALQQSLGTSSPWFSVVGEFASGETIGTGSRIRISYGEPPAALLARGVGEWSELAVAFSPYALGSGIGGIDYVRFGIYNPKQWELVDVDGRWNQTVVSGSSHPDAVWLGSSGHGASNCVLTVSGNPYSSVMNMTSSGLTLNGVTIESGKIGSLYLPLRLAYWPKKADADKYFLTDFNGNEIDYAFSTTGGNMDGCRVYWTGDFVIWEKGYADETAVASVSDERLVYGDLEAANADSLLFSINGTPIYSRTIVTNFTLCTEWAFDNVVWGDVPVAYINGVGVCFGHVTSHLIDYPISLASMKVNPLTGLGVACFTMSMTPSSGYSGGACTMRCWETGMTYAEASDDHKASVSAGTGEAVFTVIVNTKTASWKVEPATD